MGDPSARIKAVGALVLGLSFLSISGLHAEGPVTSVGAGDTADCVSVGDGATAKLLNGVPGTAFTAEAAR